MGDEEGDIMVFDSDGSVVVMKCDYVYKKGRRVVEQRVVSTARYSVDFSKNQRGSIS